jgi:hypothetical protein
MVGYETVKSVQYNFEKEPTMLFFHLGLF